MSSWRWPARPGRTSSSPCGGGSNLGGLALPFLEDTEVRLVAVEPSSCPTLTEGRFEYDFGDTADDAAPADVHARSRLHAPTIHAGGLRYHGDSPIISLLVKTGRMEAIAYPQGKVFEAAKLFANAEGKVAALRPVTASGRDRRGVGGQGDRRGKVILFNYCGHGFLDLQAYDDFNHGRLVDA